LLVRCCSRESDCGR